MKREEEIEARAYGYACESPHGHTYNWTAHHDAFADGAKWADEHPSDETIMRVLNCIGYEERSWIDTVRENWDKVNVKCSLCLRQKTRYCGLCRYNEDAYDQQAVYDYFEALKEI